MLSRSSRFVQQALARGISTTTLPNGLRVVSDNVPRAVPTVSVAVGGGSSAVEFEQSGLAHLIARSAFLGTSKRTALRFTRDTEDNGATISCTASRDDIMYTAQAHKDDLNEVVHLISEAVQTPRIIQREVEEMREWVAADIAAQHGDVSASVIDSAHSVAFRERGIGLSVMMPEFNLERLGEEDIKAYRSKLFNASNIVVSASGVEHESFVHLISKTFGSLPAGAAFSRAESKYVGGERRDVALDEATVCIALPGAALNDSKSAALTVLAAVLGSAVPATKRYNSIGNLTSRLSKLSIANSWLTEANAFSASYTSGGLFGVVASGAPSHTSKLVESIVAQLKSLADVSNDDVARARAQVALRVLVALDSTHATAEDMARQLLHTKTVVTGAAIAERLQKVTAADVSAAAKQMLARPPTVVATGNITQVPSVADIAAALK